MNATYILTRNHTFAECMPVLWFAVPCISGGLLLVKSLDMNADENCKIHHTVDYVIASPRVKKESVTPGTLIVRRGTEFTVKLLFTRPYNKDNDQLHFVFELGDLFSVEALPHFYK